MRKAELCNLLFENIDFLYQRNKIKGKGNKERISQFLSFGRILNEYKLENLCQRV
jgi:site-specific recombinase XerD